MYSICRQVCKFGEVQNLPLSVPRYKWKVLHFVYIFSSYRDWATFFVCSPHHVLGLASSWYIMSLFRDISSGRSHKWLVATILMFCWFFPPHRPRKGKLSTRKSGTYGHRKLDVKGRLRRCCRSTWVNGFPPWICLADGFPKLQLDVGSSLCHWAIDLCHAIYASKIETGQVVVHIITLFHTWLYTSWKWSTLNCSWWESSQIIMLTPVLVKVPFCKCLGSFCPELLWPIATTILLL